MRILGIDPGVSGATVLICTTTNKIAFIKHSETEADVSSFYASSQADYAFIERVSAMPKQGVTSTFKFGTNYGFLRGLLIGKVIPFEEVTPVRWQTVLSCRTGGNKNITKARAQQLLGKTSIKITHANADALLIAIYAKRILAARNLAHDTAPLKA